MIGNNLNILCTQCNNPYTNINVENYEETWYYDLYCNRCRIGFVETLQVLPDEEELIKEREKYSLED